MPIERPALYKRFDEVNTDETRFRLKIDETRFHLKIDETRFHLCKVLSFLIKRNYPTGRSG